MKRKLVFTSATESSDKRCYLNVDALNIDILLVICDHLSVLDLQSLCRALCPVWCYDAHSTVARYNTLCDQTGRSPSIEKYTGTVKSILHAFGTRIGSTADHSAIIVQWFLCAQRCYYCTESLGHVSVNLIDSAGVTNPTSIVETRLSLCQACHAKLQKNRMTAKSVSVSVGQWKTCIYRTHVPYAKQAANVVERLRSPIGTVDDAILDALLQDAGYTGTRDSFIKRYCIRQLAEPGGKDTRGLNLYLLSDVKTALGHRASPTPTSPEQCLAIKTSTARKKKTAQTTTINRLVDKNTVMPSPPLYMI